MLAHAGRLWLKARLQMRSWIYLQSQSCPHQWLGMEDAKSDVCVGVHACIGQIMFDGSSSVDGVICSRETTGRKHMRWGMESRDCSDRQRLVLLCCSILLNHSFNKVQFIRNLFVQCCNVYCAETFLNHLVPNSVYQKVWYNMCNSMKYEWCCLSRCEGMWGTCLLVLAASDWRRDCRWGVGSTPRASLAHTSDLEWKMPNQMYVWVCMRVLVRSCSMDHLLWMGSFVVGKRLAANTCAEEWNQEIAVTAKGRCCRIALKFPITRLL